MLSGRFVDALKVDVSIISYPLSFLLDLFMSITSLHTSMAV